MARKKTRQQDPNDSSDSGDGNGGGQGSANPCACKHIARAVQLGVVKKKLKGGIRTSCDTCAKQTKNANIVPDVSLCNENELSDSNWTYWFCLACAHVGCGRGQHKHAIAHFNTPRSEQHDLVVDIESWNVWCYTCEQKMAFNSTKKLQECVEYVRRHIQTSKSVESSSVQSPNLVNVSQAESTAANSSTATAVNDKDVKVRTNVPVGSSKIAAKPIKVRGLMNLGNTCFYNSVLQCLSVTPYLTKVLERLTCSGEEFTLPGDAKSEDFKAPAVLGQLGDSGAITLALLSTLLDMRSPDLHADTIRPQKLLKQVQDSFSQFRGNEQHDAHELLRHLLEGVRSDDLKRFQRVILEQHGIFGSVKNGVDDHVKKRMKLYGQQLQDFILGVEGIFKGQLVSIVECQDCKHHSTRFESFLDLSLPVMEDKPLPPMRKREQTESIVSDSGPSKYQAKKQKKAARKNNKLQKYRRNEKMDGCLTILEETAKAPDGLESEESDADVEDNVEQDTADPAEGREVVVESGYSSEKQNTGESDGTSPSITTGNEEAEEIVGKVDATSPPAPASPDVSATACFSPSAPASPTVSTSPVAPESPTAPVSACASSSPSPIMRQRTSVSVEDWSTFHTPEHVCLGSPCTYNCKANGEMRCFTPIDEELRITIPESGEGSIHISPVSHSERPVSRRGYFPGDNCTEGGVAPDFTPELENRLLSLCLNDNQDCSPENAIKAEKTFDLCENAESLQSIKEENGNDTDDLEQKSSLAHDHDGNIEPIGETFKVGDAIERKDDVSDWCKTLAPRHQSEEGDCSVTSCLNQFTSLELMTGNNKVGCDACTQKQNKGSEGKTVYTNSTKQLLISSPPPVLILHLKRFMMENFRFKKLQRFVSFPKDLDIASFCSTKSKDTPSIGESQTEVQYSLFGIVEHTGSLNTGHYVAYIKIRSDLEENDPRWAYLPLTRDFVYPHVDSSVKESTNKGNIEEKWYSISDSRVVEIAEAKVLKVQAYLLFYERIV
ncbi:ubiquitin carboxyl-terminal hydrolase 16 [Frankliniella occidentalis]|uniref:Ubiquitin carboxyl-terminal hydrolase 16 n=1 Tax=Frankliniella occidentalis TaxID=133901 RepID=A0A6J1SCE3_FRAOC|nr:ubiquitin carboxyl-terminal hydrolase 16 [Frankliniella occidentalis]